jgi:hypothetical protein
MFSITIGLGPSRKQTRTSNGVFAVENLEGGRARIRDFCDNVLAIELGGCAGL